MTAKTYTIVNDSYCNEAVEIAFPELVEFCKSEGWECELRETNNNTIIDENGEVVAEAS